MLLLKGMLIKIDPLSGGFLLVLLTFREQYYKNSISFLSFIKKSELKMTNN